MRKQFSHRGVQSLQVAALAGGSYQYCDTNVFRAPAGVYGNAVFIPGLQILWRTHITDDPLMFENFTRIFTACYVARQPVFIHQVAMVELADAVAICGRKQFQY